MTHEQLEPAASLPLFHLAAQRKLQRDIALPDRPRQGFLRQRPIQAYEFLFGGVAADAPDGRGIMDKDVDDPLTKGGDAVLDRRLGHGLRPFFSDGHPGHNDVDFVLDKGRDECRPWGFHKGDVKPQGLFSPLQRQILVCYGSHFLDGPDCDTHVLNERASQQWLMTATRLWSLADVMC